MKGTLLKENNQWIVEHWVGLQVKECPLHPEYQTILPLDLDLNGKEVEFDWCVIVDHYTGKGKEYAKLINPEYPELEGTLELCNDKVWDEIYEEYSTEQYPAFGGPFTDSISFIDWLKLYYKVPEKK